MEIAEFFEDRHDESLLHVRHQSSFKQVFLKHFGLDRAILLFGKELLDDTLPFHRWQQVLSVVTIVSFSIDESLSKPDCVELFGPFLIPLLTISQKQHCASSWMILLFKCAFQQNKLISQ